MTEYQISALSRLAMLRIPRLRANSRFQEVKSRLSGICLDIAQAIEDNDRTNSIACSLLEWAEHELGTKIDANHR